MSHLSNQFFEQFLESIQKDENISPNFKKKFISLHSEKKISKSNHLKKLLTGFEPQPKDKNENSKN